MTAKRAWPCSRSRSDAYEFSFVAVPAQRAAGVTKAGKEGYGMTLQDCVAKHGSPELSDALRRLSAEAELGRAWRKQLEDGLVALGLSLDLGGLGADAPQGGRRAG